MNPNSIWIAGNHAEFVSRAFVPQGQNIIRNTERNLLLRPFGTERRARVLPSVRRGLLLAQKLPSRSSTRKVGQKPQRGSRQGVRESTSLPRRRREMRPTSAAMRAGGQCLRTSSPRSRQINGLQFWRITISGARIAESNFQKNCWQRKIMSRLYRRVDTIQRITWCLRASHATAARGIG